MLARRLWLGFVTLLGSVELIVVERRFRQQCPQRRITRRKALLARAESNSWLCNKLEPASEGVEGRLWALFLRLGGSTAGMTAKARKLICPDSYLPAKNCLLEFDEIQHFTPQRLITLEALTSDDHIAFDLDRYRELCRVNAPLALKKGAGGYRRSTQEFPFAGGRHAQRALFDVMRDLLPVKHGLAPTIRISEFDVPSLRRDEAKARAEVRAILDKALPG